MQQRVASHHLILLLSTEIQIAFAQTYVTSVAPRDVIPSYKGARKYSFFLGGVGFEKAEVVGIKLGGLLCPTFRRRGTAAVECLDFSAPSEWSSSLVSLLVIDNDEGGGGSGVPVANKTAIARETTPQPWLLPQTPPRLTASAPVGGMGVPTVGNVTLRLAGRGFGYVPGDVCSVWWTSRDTGAALSLPPARSACAEITAPDRMLPGAVGTATGWVRSEVEQWLSQSELLVRVPPGVGDDARVVVETLGRLQSAPLVFSYDGPVIESVAPGYLLAGDTTTPFSVCGRNLGTGAASFALAEVFAGGVRCAAVTYRDGCLDCAALEGQTADGTWESAGVDVVVGGRRASSGAGLITLVPPPQLVVTPNTVAAGGTLQLSGEGVGPALSDIANVTVTAPGLPPQAVRNLRASATVSGAFDCEVGADHPAFSAGTIVPFLEVRLQTRAGLWSGAEKVTPLGVTLRPLPSLWPVGVVTWRSPESQDAMQVRWRYPGPASEADLLRSLAVIVGGEPVEPLSTASFDVQVSETPAFPQDTTVQRTVSAVGRGGTGVAGLGEAAGWVTFDVEMTVATTRPLFARVRARNADGPGPWTHEGGSVEDRLVAPSVPRAAGCAEREFRASEPAAGGGEGGECVMCPPEAVCAGLSRENITAKSGFWRVAWDGTRTAYARCLRPRACIGWSTGVLKGALVTEETALDLAQAPAYLGQPSGNATASAAKALLYGTDNATEVALFEASVLPQWEKEDAQSIATATAVPGLRLVSEEHEGCAPYHRGVLCDACSAGSFRAVGGTCEACGDTGWIAGRMFLVACAMGLLLALLLWRAWKTRGEGSSREVLIAKLVFTHLQTLSIVGSIDLRWPEAVQGFFDVMDATASATTSGLALECVMGKRSEDPFSRTGVIYSAPIWLYLFAAVVWFIHGWIVARRVRVKKTSKPGRRSLHESELLKQSRRAGVGEGTPLDSPETGLETDAVSKEDGATRPRSPPPRLERTQSMRMRVGDACGCCRGCLHEGRRTWGGFDVVTYREQILLSLVVLTFLVHTPVTKAAFKIMTCRPVGPEGELLQDDRTQMRLAMDMNLRCTGETLSRMLGMGLPVILLFSLGVPALAAYFLHRLGRERLATDETIRKRLGFLFLGYAPGRFYWESVVMLRKVVLAMVTVLLGPYGGGIQALSALLLVQGAVVLHSWAKPYESSELNKLEMFSLVVAAVSLVGGIYVVLDTETESAAASSGALAVAASVTIVGANVVLFLAVMAELNTAVRTRLHRLGDGELGSVLYLLPCVKRPPARKQRPSRRPSVAVHVLQERQHRPKRSITLLPTIPSSGPSASLVHRRPSVSVGGGGMSATTNPMLLARAPKKDEGSGAT